MSRDVFDVTRGSSGSSWVMVYRGIPGNVPECKVQVFPGFCVVCLKFVEFPGCRIQVISGFYGDLSICVALARTGETARSKVWNPLHNNISSQTLTDFLA